MPRYGMVVDLDRCMGCRACMEACKVENATGEDTFWMYVFRFEEGAYPNTAVNYLPRPCMHCDNPPCVKVCPVGARFKQEDGLVLTDAERCIGCRYCEVACPYGVNYFAIRHPEDSYYVDWSAADLEGEAAAASPPYRNPDLDRPHGAEGRLVAGGGHEKGVMEKCTFCVHRLEQGLDPACVSNCPTDVFTFGDLDDPGSAVSKELKKPHFRLLEESGTRPRVYYTGGAPPTDDARQFDPVGGNT
jgi:Fe-S-cluster-containing dehydrogenase component